jgi:hypothetical protein
MITAAEAREITNKADKRGCTICGVHDVIPQCFSDSFSSQVYSQAQSWCRTAFFTFAKSDEIDNFTKQCESLGYIVKIEKLKLLATFFKRYNCKNRDYILTILRNVAVPNRCLISGKAGRFLVVVKW